MGGPQRSQRDLNGSGEPIVVVTALDELNASVEVREAGQVIPDGLKGLGRGRDELKEGDLGGKGAKGGRLGRGCLFDMLSSLAENHFQVAKGLERTLMKGVSFH
jgi:hypothetical protein